MRTLLCWLGAHEARGWWSAVDGFVRICRHCGRGF